MALVAFSFFGSIFAMDIGGTYSVDGKNPNGSGYQGIVVIEEIGDLEYSFSWQIGDESYAGSGTLEENVLTVDWGQAEPVIYTVSPDGSKLIGIWGPDGSGSEILTRSDSE